MGLDEDEAAEKAIQEVGQDNGDVDSKLADIGHGFNLDSNIGNYIKDDSGNVKYMESFKPWLTFRESVTPGKLESLFDEEELREAIDNIQDPIMKETCLGYLDRLMTLMQEEQADQERLALEESSSPESSDPHINELLHMLEPIVSNKALLAALNALTTAEEAQSSKEWNMAKEAMGFIAEKMRGLPEETDTVGKDYGILAERYKIASRAVGIINRGTIDHTR